MNLLVSWLGDGGQPSPVDIAYKRADVCRVCPRNNKGSWLRFVTGPIAVVIRQTLALKHKMNLTVPREKEELGTCEVCFCQTKLKVWVPPEHLRKTETASDFPPNCWIPKELEQPQDAVKWYPSPADR